MKVKFFPEEKLSKNSPESDKSGISPKEYLGNKVYNTQ